MNLADNLLPLSWEANVTGEHLVPIEKLSPFALTTSLMYNVF